MNQLIEYLQVNFQFFKKFTIFCKRVLCDYFLHLSVGLGPEYKYTWSV